jgi:mannose-1-phosphate guanylyltransferase
MNQRYVVIMAGGRGERFWPASRLSRPKQLLPIVGEKALLLQVLDRVRGIVPMDRVVIVTNREQATEVRRICSELPAENILEEPVGRDTAPAVGLATVWTLNRSPNAVFAMLPADQVIHNEAGFKDILNAAFLAAEQRDTFVTIGIQPTYPATGYGYIERGSLDLTVADQPVFSVKRFVEKPNLEKATEYLNEGGFFWNAGMFVWKASLIAEALSRDVPDLWAGLLQIQSGLNAGKPVNTLLADIYPSLKKISVDYAIMEKARSVHMIEAQFDWDDVGEWPAVARHFPADAAGNVTKGMVVLESAKNNIVMGDPEHLTAVIGVEDLIIVHTADATLICPREKAQDIKTLIKKMEADAALKKRL